MVGLKPKKWKALNIFNPWTEVRGN